jgi:hypothetical protein
MSIHVEGSEFLPHHFRGKLKRTSGPITESEGVAFVYLHVEELEGETKGTEAALTFRVNTATALFAAMAVPGDIVSIEWIPADCRNRADVLIADATRFHLSRKVHRAYGNGFDRPEW